MARPKPLQPSRVASRLALVGALVAACPACLLTWERDDGGSGGATSSVTTGSGPVQCGDVLLCQPDCSNGCEVHCGGSGSCNVDCGSQGCEVFCESTSACSVTCQSGGACTIHGGTATTVTATCTTASSCDVTCGAGQCDLNCSVGSTASLDCGASVGCAYHTDDTCSCPDCPPAS